MLFVLLLTGAPLLAQFVELATTHTGDTLYFSTTLARKGQAPKRSEFRIYRWNSAGPPELAAERGDLAFRFGGGSGDGARLPQVSADGETFAYTLQGICEPGETCNSNAVARAVVVTRWFDGNLGDGAVQISANGQWALFTPTPSRGPGPGSPIPAPAALIRLGTGERVNVPPPAPFFTQAVADDGSVIVQDPGPSRIALWRAGQSTPINSSGGAWGRSADGRRLLYTSFLNGFRLIVRDLVTGADTEILPAATDGSLPQWMGVSADGRRALYRIAGREPEGPAFLVDTVTRQRTPIPLPAGELATGGTLSGSGEVAFLVTNLGRLVRFAGGEISQVVPPTALLRNSNQLSPGSFVRLEGTLPRVKSQLDGAILLNDVPMPILWANEREIAAQTPWELANRFEATLRVALAGESSFEQNELIFLPQVAPRFEGTPAAGLSFPGVMISTDWRVLTTDPQPGQIIHLYFSGLGAVNGNVATGVPTPVDKPYPILARLTCRFTPYTQDAETLFAGLTPGLIGLYQVTLRMPPGPNPGRLTGGRCSGDAAGGGNFGLFWGQQ